MIHVQGIIGGGGARDNGGGGGEGNVKGISGEFPSPFSISIRKTGWNSIE